MDRKEILEAAKKEPINNEAENAILKDGIRKTSMFVLALCLFMIITQALIKRSVNYAVLAALFSFDAGIYLYSYKASGKTGEKFYGIFCAVVAVIAFFMFFGEMFL